MRRYLLQRRYHPGKINLVRAAGLDNTRRIAYPVKYTNLVYCGCRRLGPGLTSHDDVNSEYMQSYIHRTTSHVNVFVMQYYVLCVQNTVPSCLLLVSMISRSHCQNVQMAAIDLTLEWTFFVGCPWRTLNDILKFRVQFEGIAG